MELGNSCMAIQCVSALMSDFANGEHAARAAGGQVQWREILREMYADVLKPLLEFGQQLEAFVGAVEGLQAPEREAAIKKAADYLVSLMCAMNHATVVSSSPDSLPAYLLVAHAPVACCLCAFSLFLLKVSFGSLLLGRPVPHRYCCLPASLPASMSACQHASTVYFGRQCAYNAKH